MNYKKILIGALLFSGLTGRADSFDEVVNTIATNNLTAKYNLAIDEAALEEMRDENTLEAPEIGFDHLWGDSKEAGNKLSVSISQSFDWPGVYAARRDAIKKSSYAMQYLREASMMDVKMQVRQMLIDIIYTRQKINALSKLSESMGKLVETYRILMEQKQQTRLDYNKAVIEKIDIDRELESLKGQYSVLESALEALNGARGVDDLLSKVGDDYPAYDLAVLRPNIDMVKERDPQYAASLASIEANKSLLKAEKLSRLPGFSLGYVHELENGDRFNGFSFSISLPFLKKSHNVKAAQLRGDAINYEAEMQVTQRVAEMNGAYRQAVELRKLIDKYNMVIEGDSNFELLKKALDAGEISFITYLQEVHYFHTARINYLDILYEYNQSLAKLVRYN